MFSTFTGFFSIYIPLVVFAVVCILFEEKVIAFEQRLFKAIKANAKKSTKKGGQNNA